MFNLSYKSCKPEDSEGLRNSMFTNIKLSDNRKGRLLEFYNEFSKIAEKIFNNIESEQQKKFKKRKLSLPDNLLRINSLESDSAFNESLKMYEAFSKGLFSNQYVNIININQNKIGSFSAMTSPMINRSVNTSANGLYNTPRTNRVKNYFSEFELGQPISINLNDLGCKSPIDFKKKLQERLPSGIKSSNILNLYFLGSSNIFSSLGSDSKEFDCFNLLNRADSNISVKSNVDNTAQSQTTPEFNRTFSK